jgi:hypothetical protein
MRLSLSQWNEVAAARSVISIRNAMSVVSCVFLILSLTWAAWVIDFSATLLGRRLRSLFARTNRFALALRWLMAVATVVSGAVTQLSATTNALAQVATTNSKRPCLDHAASGALHSPDGQPLPCCVKHACDCDFVHSSAIVLEVPTVDDPMPDAVDFARPKLCNPQAPFARPLRPPIA